MVDYLQIPSTHTRATLTSRLAELISSLVIPRIGRSSSGTAGQMWLLRNFICSVITSSRSNVSALVVALAYLNRAKERLDPNLFGATLVCERIFIAALVLATKYTQDSCRRNPRWARVARIFTARQISSAELQLLHALEWDLSITEEDMLE